MQNELKQLKQQLWKSQLPVWLEQVENTNSVPFLFLTLKDMSVEDMREITAYLNNKKPGLYFLVSETDNKIAFLASVAPQLAKTIQLKNFGSWLKDNYGLRGGGSETHLQGGGTKIDPKLGESIKQWLAEQK